MRPCSDRIWRSRSVSPRAIGSDADLEDRLLRRPLEPRLVRWPPASSSDRLPASHARVGVAFVCRDPRRTGCATSCGISPSGMSRTCRAGSDCAASPAPIRTCAGTRRAPSGFPTAPRSSRRAGSPASPVRAGDARPARGRSPPRRPSAGSCSTPRSAAPATPCAINWRCVAMAFTTGSSIRNPRRDAMTMARSMRTGSSWKRSLGSPMQRIRPSFRSCSPPT